MRNVTISLNDELVRWARVWAAENDTSISAMLSQLLKEKMEKESRYVSAMNNFHASEVSDLSSGLEYPSREILYER